MKLSFQSLIRPVAMLAIAGLFVTARPLQAASSREKREFNAATAAIRDGFWERAENEFGEFAKKHPASELRAQALLYQAQARFKMTNSDGAAELLMANKDGAGSLADEYQFWLAEAQFQSRDYVGAAGSYAKVVADFPVSNRRLEAC